MREKDLTAPLQLDESIEIEDVKTYEGFVDYKEEALAAFLKTHGMAMSLADIKLIQDYFLKEETKSNRNRVKSIRYLLVRSLPSAQRLKH